MYKAELKKIDFYLKDQNKYKKIRETTRSNYDQIKLEFGDKHLKFKNKVDKDNE